MNLNAKKTTRKNDNWCMLPWSSELQLWIGVNDENSWCSKILFFSLSRKRKLRVIRVELKTMIINGLRLTHSSWSIAFGIWPLIMRIIIGHEINSGYSRCSTTNWSTCCSCDDCVENVIVLCAIFAWRRRRRRRKTFSLFSFFSSFGLPIFFDRLRTFIRTRAC